MAKNATKKTRRVNIRLSERDFERINIKAVEENIPYQTLIGSVIHKQSWEKDGGKKSWNCP